MEDLFKCHLPFEIISKIFSYVTPEDCLEVMSVSHRWFEQVPRYTADFWKEVNFVNDLLYQKKTLCLINCLESNVTKVTLPYDVAYNIIEQLTNRRTIITDLVIKDEDKEPFKTADCTVRFSNMMESISFHLTKLVLHGYHDELLLVELACLCPQLVHLEVYLSYDIDLDEKRQEKRSNTHNDYQHDNDGSSTATIPTQHQQELFSCLLYLGLDCRFSFSRRVKPFLGYCPNVRVMHIAGYLYYLDKGNLNDTNFTDIFQLCPDLYTLSYSRNLDCGGVFPLDDNSRVFYHRQQHQQTQGIRQVMVAYDNVVRRSFRTILPLLEQSQNTLRVLKIDGPRGYVRNSNANSDNINSWSQFLERGNIKFPHLQELALTTVDMRTTTLCDILSSTITTTHDTTCDHRLNTPSPFYKHHQYYYSSLTKLSLRLWYYMFNNHQFIHVLSQLRYIEQLDLDILPGAESTEGDRRFPDDNFHQLLGLPLKTLQIRGATYISDHVMSTVLGCFDSMENLSLSFGSRYTVHVKTKTLLNFVNNLRQYMQKSNGEGTLRMLTLVGFSNISDKVMEALGDLHSVQEFTFSSFGITDAGLRKFVDKITVTTTRYVPRVYLYDYEINWDCLNEESLAYAKNVLGKNNFVCIGNILYPSLNR